MAQAEDISHLQIGREVYLHPVAGIYYFTVKKQLQKVRAAMQKILHRAGRNSKRTKIRRLKANTLKIPLRRV